MTRCLPNVDVTQSISLPGVNSVTHFVPQTSGDLAEPLSVPASDYAVEYSLLSGFNNMASTMSMSSNSDTRQNLSVRATCASIAGTTCQPHVRPVLIPRVLMSAQRSAIVHPWQPRLASRSGNFRSQLNTSGAGGSFDFKSGFVAVEDGCPASACEAARQKTSQQRKQNGCHEAAISKPLFAVRDFDSDVRMQKSALLDENDNCCASSKIVLEDSGWNSPLPSQNAGIHLYMGTVAPPPCRFPRASRHRLPAGDCNFSTRKPSPATRQRCFTPMFRHLPPPPPPPPLDEQPPTATPPQPRVSPWMQQHAVHTPSFVAPVRGLCFSPLFQPLSPPPPPPLPPPSDAPEQWPAMASCLLAPPPPPPVPSGGANPSQHLPATSAPLAKPPSFDLTKGLETMGLSTLASASTDIRLPRPPSNNPTAKPFLGISALNAAGGLTDDDNVPASWEDVEDFVLPEVKNSTTAASSDDSAADWFAPKPGQLESARWSMTFRRQATTTTVQCSEWVARTESSLSAPPTSRSRKNERRSLNLFRPGADDDDDTSPEWSEEFMARYKHVTTPYVDSHCHLDFLFRRSGFSGSFQKYRRCYSNTFPASFAGCISIFCNPRTWTYESEGKISVFFFIHILLYRHDSTH